MKSLDTKQNNINNTIGLRETLHIYAMHLTGSRSLAEELVQETTLRIIQKLDTCRAIGDFESWAKLLMKHIFINSVTPPIPTAHTIDCNYSSNAADKDNTPICNSKEVFYIVSLLPSQQATIIALILQGYNYNQIAQKMGISIASVKQHISQARINIKKLLKE